MQRQKDKPRRRPGTENFVNVLVGLKREDHAKLRRIAQSEDRKIGPMARRLIETALKQIDVDQPSAV